MFICHGSHSFRRCFSHSSSATWLESRHLGSARPSYPSWLSPRRLSRSVWYRSTFSLWATWKILPAISNRGPKTHETGTKSPPPSCAPTTVQSQIFCCPFIFQRWLILFLTYNLSVVRRDSFHHVCHYSFGLFLSQDRDNLNWKVWKSTVIPAVTCFEKSFDIVLFFCCCHRSRQTILPALCYTGLFVVILVGLLAIGYIVPTRDLPAPNSTLEEQFKNVMDELKTSRNHSSIAKHLKPIT